MATVRLWAAAGSSDSGFNAVAHIAEKKVFVAGDEDGCIHFFSGKLFSLRLSRYFLRLDNGNKLQSMSISDEEITSICAGANGTIFVAAEEIVYQVGMERNRDI